MLSIGPMFLSEIAQFFISMDVLLTEEHQKQIDFIMYPHVTKNEQKKIYRNYCGMPGEGDPVGASKLMAIKYAKHFKRKDQSWPSGK